MNTSLIQELVLFFYTTPSNANGRSPLELSARGVIVCFLIAIVSALIMGNIIIHSLYEKSISSLNSLTYNLSANEYDDVTEKIKVLLPENSQIEDVDGNLMKMLQGKNNISFTDFSSYWRTVVPGLKHEELIRDCLGSLSNFPFLMLNLQTNFDLLERKYNLRRPTNNIFGSLSEEEVNYFVGLSFLSNFRRQLSSGGNILTTPKPHRWVKLLGGLIQWASFIAFTWGLLLIIVRAGMARIQKQLILQGQFVEEDEESNKNIWQVTKVASDEELPFFDLERIYPNLFLPVTIIREVYKRLRATINTSNTVHRPEDLPKLDDIVSDQVMVMRTKLDGEYELLNFITWITPTLGFIGTVVGVIAAMDTSVLVLLEKESSGQAEAMTIVTSNLAVAFDTTFVALSLNIPLLYLITTVRKREVRLFEILENESVKRLKEI